VTKERTEENIFVSIIYKKRKGKGRENKENEKEEETERRRETFLQVEHQEKNANNYKE
jgi:hypothetical protein